MNTDRRVQCRPRVTSGRRRVRPAPAPPPLGWVGRVSRQRPPRWVSAMFGSALALGAAVVLEL